MDKGVIKQFIEDHIKDSDIFLVDIVIKPGNIIRVFVDKPEGITIDECVELSREFNASFDRDTEDYELQVSSPGLDMPLKVPQQFEKYRERDIQVILMDGTILKGLLLDFDEDELKILESRKERQEGKKRKILVTEEKILKHSAIKTVKAIISFK